MPSWTNLGSLGAVSGNTSTIGDDGAKRGDNAHVLSADIKEMTRDQLEARFSELMLANQAALERENDLANRLSAAIDEANVAGAERSFWVGRVARGAGTF